MLPGMRKQRDCQALKSPDGARNSGTTAGRPPLRIGSDGKIIRILWVVACGWLDAATETVTGSLVSCSG
jgi:hypothetical protein